MNYERKITPATWITLSRFLLAPLSIYFFMQERYTAAVVTLIAAGISDGLDGFIARRFKMRSHLGSMLDPLADKFLMLGSYIALSQKKLIPWELTTLVIGRDILIVAGALFLKSLKIRLFYKPTRVSKVATFSQISLVVFVLIQFFVGNWKEETHALLEKTIIIFMGLTALTTVITAFQYAVIGYRFYRYGQRQQ